MRSSFGRFQLLELLGEGGQGQVYAAHDPQLDRTVALKILRANSESSADRALAEGRTLARLSHPSLVPIHEVVTEQGMSGLVMELAEGPNLRQWLLGHRSRRAVLDALLGVAQGLAALHRAGLVHRDVKPSNVVFGADEAARLVDLGLASETHRELRESACGTARYMAPEQKLGGSTIGSAADQYSFAVMAWEALTGERPPRSPTVAARSSALPRGLTVILNRALQVDPERRYGDMQELISALGRWRRRRGIGRLAGWGAGAMATLTLVGVAFGGRPDSCEEVDPRVDGMWTRDDRHTLRDRLAGLDVPAAPQFADVVVAQLDERAEAARRFDRELCTAEELGHDIQRKRTCLVEYTEVFPMVVDSIAALDGASVADATGRIARLQSPEQCAAPGDTSAHELAPLDERYAAARTRLRGIELTCTPSSLEECMESLDAFERDREDLPSCAYGPDLLLARGRALQLRDRDTAIEFVSQAAWEAERCGLVDREFQSKALAASMVALRGDLAPAEFWLAAAEATLARIGETAVRAAQLESARASVERRRGNLPKALAHALEEVALLESAGPLAEDRTATAYVNAGRAAIATGELDLASDLVTRGLARLEETHGTDHPEVAQALGTLAHVESLRDRGRSALALLERASTMLELWDRPTRLAAALNNRAAVHSQLEEHGRALGLIERAFRIKQELFAEDDPRMILALSNLGRAAALAGSPEDGIAKMRDAVHNASKLGPDDPVSVTSRGNLASELFNAGAYSEAAELACDVARRKAQQSARHPDTWDARRLCLRSIDASFVYGDRDAGS